MRIVRHATSTWIAGGYICKKKPRSLMMGHPSSGGNVKVAPLSPIGVHKFRNKALQCKISPIKSPRRIFRLRGNVLKGSGYRLFDLWHDSVRAGTKCLQATQYITLHCEPPNNSQYRPATFVPVRLKLSAYLESYRLDGNLKQILLIENYAGTQISLEALLWMNGPF